MNSKLVLVVGLIVGMLGAPMFAQAKDKGVKAAGTDLTFQVPATCTISVTGNASAKLSDVKVGDKVGVAYDENNGTLTAASVRVIDPTAKKEHKKGEKSADHKHTAGTVAAVDTTANTLTVTPHAHHKK